MSVLKNLASSTAPAGAERRDDKGRPLRIVVADDDRDTVDMLAVVLRDEGHVVHSAYTGRDVLPAVRLYRPDAVIMDISIPGLSGYAVAHAIRNSFMDVRRPLLIAISGIWTEAPDRLVGEQVGFDHRLKKPCETAELLRLLEPLRRRQ